MSTAAPLPFYVDGYASPDRELVVLPVPQFPFSKNPTPDRYSTVQPRDYQVLPRLYTPRIANRTAWTNLLTYSQAFENAAWTKNSATATADQAVAPDGETTMDSILEAAASAEHSVSRALSLTAASSTISVFAAAGLSRDWIRIKFVDSAAAVFTCFFNITGGTVGNASAGVTGSIVPMVGGRFRCQMTFTPAAGAGTLTVNISTDGSTVSYLGDIAKGVYLWGAQAVTASTSGPYISTTSTTRAISAPDQERTINVNARAQDPLAYLVEEDDPELITSEVALLRRKFARVPLSQVTFSTVALTKPTAAGAGGDTTTYTRLYSDYTQAANLGNPTIYSGYAFCPNNTIYGILKTSTSANSGADTRITCASHGFTGTAPMVVRGIGSNAYLTIFQPSEYSVIDANTIDILNHNYGTSLTVIAQYLRAYTPGADRIGTRLTKTFYLPGVTAGITTAADIPVPDPLINDATFLAAVLANLTGYVTYDAEPIDQWMGPIYAQQLIELNFANV